MGVISFWIRHYNLTCLGLVYRVTLLVLMGMPPADAEFSNEKAGFSVHFKGEVIPYRVMGIFVLPGEKVKIAVRDSLSSGHYELLAGQGEMQSLGPNSWQWTAPLKSQVYVIDVIGSESGEKIQLNAFVMVPYERMQNGRINGYRIDAYPSVPLRGMDIYKIPQGFVEVTQDNENTLVAPHFRLKDFLCKQESGYPKYVIVKERLLLKLELILESVNAKGHACQTLTIMSGYRTPYYNRAIGNVKYSRHVWGGAADFYIDENPKDGVMDDLNRDGKIDYRDAAIIYELVDEMFGKVWYQPFVGGLGQYEKNAAHGPFVHTDVRGFRARWGK